MSQHRDQLRNELLEAARRRADAAEPHRGPVGRSRWTAAAVAAIAAVLIGGGLVTADTRTAAAQVFAVEERGETLVIEVVGRVENPTEAAAELKDLDVQVRLVGVPAAPSMVGDVVSTEAHRGTADVEERNGRVSTIRVPRQNGEHLTIRYGRPARTGETYEATESVPGCASLAGRPLTPAIAETIRRRWGPDVDWRVASQSGLHQAETDGIPDGSRIVDVLPLTPSAVMAIVTDGAEPIPPGMGC